MLGHDFMVVSIEQASSLTFLIYEICITFDDEVNLIWSLPNHCWIKWQFLFIRYFALASHITNLIMSQVTIYNQGTISVAMRNWYLCQVVMWGISLLALELVLMARVYALYKRAVWLRFGFVVLILAKVTVVVVGVIINIPADHHIGFTSPRSYLAFGISAVISQVTILGLTLIKYWSAIQEGWNLVPIMTLVVRDGILTFVILIIVTTLTLVATTAHKEYASIGTSWLSSIAACAGCRLIVNIQHFSRESERPTTVELTSLRYSGFSDMSRY